MKNKYFYPFYTHECIQHLRDRIMTKEQELKDLNMVLYVLEFHIKGHTEKGQRVMDLETLLKDGEPKCSDTNGGEL